MAVPSNKIELKEAIIQNYQKLKKELLLIPIHLTHIKELEGHSKNSLMSINNLVSYLIGWQELVIKWNNTNKEELHLPEVGYKWNELGGLANKFYKDYENDDFNLLINKLDSKVNLILEIVEKKSNKKLYEENWYKNWTLGRMIQLNTSSPFSNARNRIRKWKRDIKEL